MFKKQDWGILRRWRGMLRWSRLEKYRKVFWPYRKHGECSLPKENMNKENLSFLTYVLLSFKELIKAIAPENL